MANQTISKSTKSHRNSQRASAMLQVAGGAISTVALSAQIPIKFSQALLSGFSFFNKDLKPQEKFIQGSQWLISTIQVALMIALFLTGKEFLLACALITRLILLSEMLYQGILLVGWLPAELSKETEDPVTSVSSLPKATTPLLPEPSAPNSISPIPTATQELTNPTAPKLF